MAATSFAGIFVDGDRERLPYEADAYIDQLGWYNVTGDVVVPRRTFEFLIKEPNWPTEWQPHMIFMAWADYMFTGDESLLRTHYERLKYLILHQLIGDDGLVDVGNASSDFKSRSRLTYRMQDIVDWPPNQRDGHDMRPKNTVTNAFAYAAQKKMAIIASVPGNESDISMFEQSSARIADGLSALARLPNGLYADGVGSTHTSAHSLFLPLLFGLVDDNDRPKVLTAIKQRIAAYDGGFPNSPFAAQYLLEALFENGLDYDALDLIVNTTDRGWLNMIRAYDATIMHEAWDIRFKDNEDWTHAWASAPANILPKYLLGIRTSSPGWSAWTLSPLEGAEFLCQRKNSNRLGNDRN